MTKELDYKYLRAWCRMMGSYPYYVEAELEAARRDKAPQDVVFRTDGEWRRFASVTSLTTRAIINRYVEEFDKVKG